MRSGLFLMAEWVAPMNEIPAEFTILALEASADQASAAVLSADGRQVQHCHAARHGHAAVMTELARAALADAGLDAGKLTHVAAGRGPGSFTGIRVALAAAKGFGLASGAAGIGVSCLAAAAYAARRSVPQAADSLVVATADTRRGSFFAQAFSPDGEAMSEIIDLDPESDQPVSADWQGALLVGPGAAQLAAAFADGNMRPETALPAIDSLQVAQLAADRLTHAMPLDPLLPLYVAPAFLGPRKS